MPPEPASAAQCGSELVLCLLLMEVSNPFLHWRSMLKARLTAHPFALPHACCMSVLQMLTCNDMSCMQERDQGGTKLAAINDVRLCLLLTLTINHPDVHNIAERMYLG